MKAPAIILLALGLVLLFGFMAWAIMDVGGFGALFGRSTGTNIVIGLGVIAVAALTAVLMRLAFVSARRGFDEPVQFQDADDDRSEPNARRDP
jgi:cation transporter-like permease